MRLLPFVPLIILLFLGSKCREQGRVTAREDLETTTVCEIMREPERFDLKTVRFRADFETDGIERSVLTHPGCPYRGIVPYDTIAIPPQERTAFDDAVYGGKQGTIDREISATFTGVFHAHTAPHPLLVENPPWTIRLTHVANATVHLRSTGT